MINEWFKKIQYYFVFDFGIEDLNLPLNNNIECVHCHAIKNKIKNYATDKVKKL